MHPVSSYKTNSAPGVSQYRESLNDENRDQEGEKISQHRSSEDDVGHGYEDGLPRQSSRQAKPEQADRTRDASRARERRPPQRCRSGERRRASARESTTCAARRSHSPRRARPGRSRVRARSRNGRRRSAPTPPRAGRPCAEPAGGRLDAARARRGGYRRGSGATTSSITPTSRGRSGPATRARRPAAQSPSPIPRT